MVEHQTTEVEEEEADVKKLRERECASCASESESDFRHEKYVSNDFYYDCYFGRMFAPLCRFHKCMDLKSFLAHSCARFL